ncbi:2-dehydro-3-deoxyphosphooctonate aldolase [Flavobacterium azooxidireducens]|uniref:2-dehydro-3-deoxyphosphooctonate aldolase n=1 Tax=Flavobacterium azooxidireducens TaxID=1871076 RepID=A0ABY4KF60_9FLAO|nr:2-dehydro-3-deoxyphosphooctonate aldolase [Flavobacterium azooxidireducens]UPQ79199.1 2-dehydro-3-deoxyphosphooctonate aldolase [Flavobacterium azooxidireducens]
MKKHTFLFLLFTVLCMVSCGGIKNTIKNIDDSAPTPMLKKDNSFVLTEVSDNSKYGYDPDYPINIFYRTISNDTINQERFLKALAGPNGEKLFYKKLESCCPFPTKRSEIGAGFLDVYQVHWMGSKKPLLLYFNIYEKGKLMVPKGLTAKKDEQP